MPENAAPATGSGSGLVLAARRIAAARTRADQPSDNTGGKSDSNDTGN
ncbi:hypothetical protein ACH4UT_27410 [Streptomyces sp. NPDC020799]